MKKSKIDYSKRLRTVDYIKSVVANAFQDKDAATFDFIYANAFLDILFEDAEKIRKKLQK